MIIDLIQEGIPTYQEGTERRRTLYHELADIVQAAVYLNGPLSFKVSEIPDEVEAELIILIEEGDIITLKVRDADGE